MLCALSVPGRGGPVLNGGCLHCDLPPPLPPHPHLPPLLHLLFTHPQASDDLFLLLAHQQQAAPGRQLLPLWDSGKTAQMLSLLYFAELGIRSFDFQAKRSFLSKNERMSGSLKKMSNSLICSFLVSEMSDSLTSLISSERTERIVHVRSFLVSEMSNSLILLI